MEQDTHLSRNALLAGIAARAEQADRSDGDITEDIDALRSAGWLIACLPSEAGGKGWGSQPFGTMPAFEALRDTGRANLSVARLFEGHMNAVKLIALYGDEPARDGAFGAVQEGAMLGVWGADAPGDALRIDGDRLSGAKRFASGLGIVTHALVSIDTGGGVQLALAPSHEPARSDASGWRVSGMRATQSGLYEFTGVPLDQVAMIGAPGDYFTEPYFEGGVWRYCAAHLGAAEALYAQFSDMLAQQNRTDDPHQRDRLARAAMALETARLWLLRASAEVEARGALPRKAALSLFARDVTERCCRTVMAEVEGGLGMAAHAQGTNVERIRRDLSLFLCQAVPDAKRQRAVETLTETGGRIEHL